MSDIIVTSDGFIKYGGLRFRCALGKGGVKPEADKREGDGATPLGRYALRQVYYRVDRLAAPDTRLPLQALTPQDGWCDDPGDPAYNRQEPTKAIRLASQKKPFERHTFGHS